MAKIVILCNDHQFKILNVNGLSVVIITYNEEKNIGRCIDSVKELADEIIILDSFSTDNTRTIALQKGAKVYESTFEDYVTQKNEANKYASYKWVLSLDADEALSPELFQSIKQLMNEPSEYVAYKCARLTNYCGKWIRHSGWYPNFIIRLFNKDEGSWQGYKIHEKWKLNNNGKVGRLRGDLLHYSYNDLEAHIKQNNKFSTISANAYLEKGKKSNWLKMILNPSWAFIYSYIVRLGFLDGYFGFVIACNVAHLTFMKYYKLYALQNGIKVSKN